MADTCQVLGAAGMVRNLVGGSTASGAGRFVPSISTTSSSGDASRAREAGRIELERLFMVSNRKWKEAEGIRSLDQITSCATKQNW